MMRRNRLKFEKSHLKGTFMVEFAIVGIFFAAALAFCADSVVIISTKGKLDRLAYSGVSLVKERTILFDEDDFSVSDAEFTQLEKLLKNALQRTLINFDSQRFGIRLETWIPEVGASAPKNGGAVTCNAMPALTEDSSVMTTWGRRASVYRVTLCYDVPSWFAAFIPQSQTLIQSNALMIGR